MGKCFACAIRFFTGTRPGILALSEGYYNPQNFFSRQYIVLNGLHDGVWMLRMGVCEHRESRT
jgi:hypothetical protein